jgi:hypothetical protein
MTALRIYLIIAWAAFVVLNTYVAARLGFAASFSDFAASFATWNWQAAFDADLLIHLSLAGLWTGWRNGWTPLGWLLALCAFMGGTLFTGAYLLVLLHLEKGDMRRVLLGQRAG